MNFIIEVPPYPVEIMVSIGERNRKLSKRIKGWADNKDDARTLIESLEYDKSHMAITHHLKGTGFIIIRLYKKVKNARDKGVLAHEIFHAVENIAEQVELRHGRKSSEAWAYLTSFITEQIYKKI
jgi:hypothetical protein